MKLCKRILRFGLIGAFSFIAAWTAMGDKVTDCVNYWGAWRDDQLRAANGDNAKQHDIWDTYYEQVKKCHEH